MTPDMIVWDDYLDLTEELVELLLSKPTIEDRLRAIGLKVETKETPFGSITIIVPGTTRGRRTNGGMK